MFGSSRTRQQLIGHSHRLAAKAALAYLVIASVLVGAAKATTPMMHSQVEWWSEFLGYKGFFVVAVSTAGVYYAARFAAGRVWRSQQELLAAQQDILQRLALAVEARDGGTAQHTVRMARYCEAIAREMCLGKRTCDLIFQASQLHDIGKIGLPDHILLKRGLLTPEERNTMQTHVEIGVGLLEGSNSPLLRLAEQIVQSHHERWDGTGYPNGISKGEIPVSARIAALCDVFDALTSERPYKAAWTFEEASDEIRRQSGKHFDPAVVAAFVRASKKIRAINLQYADPCAIVDRDLEAA